MIASDDCRHDCEAGALANCDRIEDRRVSHLATLLGDFELERWAPVPAPGRSKQFWLGDAQLKLVVQT